MGVVIQMMTENKVIHKVSLWTSLPADLLSKIDKIVEDRWEQYKISTRVMPMIEWMYSTPEGRKTNSELVRNLSLGIKQSKANEIARNRYLQATNQKVRRPGRPKGSGDYKKKELRNEVIAEILQEFFDRKG